jgi:hypothetical protein
MTHSITQKLVAASLLSISSLAAQATNVDVTFTAGNYQISGTTYLDVVAGAGGTSTTYGIGIVTSIVDNLNNSVYTPASFADPGNKNSAILFDYGIINSTAAFPCGINNCVNDSSGNANFYSSTTANGTPLTPVNYLNGIISANPLSMVSFAGVDSVISTAMGGSSSLWLSAAFSGITQATIDSGTGGFSESGFLGVTGGSETLLGLSVGQSMTYNIQALPSTTPAPFNYNSIAGTDLLNNVPEPSIMALLGIAVFGFGMSSKKKK